MRCPLAEANALDEKKRIKIGWASVKINLLPARQMQCFKCLRVGHTKARCNSEVDRSNLCYNCGQNGHKVTACREKAKCVLCEEEGKACNHRLEGPRCLAAPSKRTGIFRRSPTKRKRKRKKKRRRKYPSKSAGIWKYYHEPDVDMDGAETMETEELEDSVVSDLVENYYEGKDFTS